MPLKEEDRLKGAKNSLTKRQQQQAERREKVRFLYYEKRMSKAKIARELGVDRGTVISDLKEVE